MTARERYLASVDWLETTAGHPVVQIVHRDDERLILSTGFVGATTASCAELHPADAAQLLAAVGRAIARLHANGLVHGNLVADHIVLRGSRFWLCSPATTPAEPSSDVVALASLAEGFVDTWEHSAARSGLSRADRRRWLDVVAVASDPSMSAARLAARVDRLHRRRRSAA